MKGSCLECLYVSMVMIDGKLREAMCLFDPSPYFTVNQFMRCDFWAPQENVVYPITFKNGKVE